MKSVAIVGCGWYGWPLAEFLVSKKVRVWGSTTSDDKLLLLKKNGIKAFKFGLTDNLAVIPNDALKVDYLIFNIPPGGNLDHEYNFSFEVRRLIQYWYLKHPTTKVIFISSTSVLDGQIGEVTEEAERTAKEGNGIILSKLEQWLMKTLPNSTILRFAGLYGDGRHPAHYLSGKINLGGASKPVNLTHIDDAIGATVHIMAKQIEGEILHICANDHPSRKEYYTKSCERLNLDKPHFRVEDEPTEGKIVTCDRLIYGYDYKLIRPSVYMGITN